MGRKKALLYTIVFMGVTTALIGLLPTYHRGRHPRPAAPPAAARRAGHGVGRRVRGRGGVRRGVGGAEPPRLLHLVRLQQLLPRHPRGAGTAALTSWLVQGPALESWGWRLPFILALPLSLVGMWLRRHISESPEFVRATENGADVVKAPVREALRSQWRPILVFCGASIMLAILSYTWVTFYPEYLTGIARSAPLDGGWRPTRSPWRCSFRCCRWPASSPTASAASRC
ncbi:hypothetical protein LV779_24935 [Streptomyces thinghirensis]|nr:hypothetical protein [Streptomyces thinghirensis]